MTDKDDASVHETEEPSQAQPETLAEGDFAAAEQPHETSPFFVISSGDEVAEPVAEDAAEAVDVQAPEPTSPEAAEVAAEDAVGVEAVEPATEVIAGTPVETVEQPPSELFPEQPAAQIPAEQIVEGAADATPEAELSDGLTAQLQALTEELADPAAESEAAAMGDEAAVDAEGEGQPDEGAEGAAEDAAEGAAAAESLDDIAPGTVAGAESGEEPGTVVDAELLLDEGPKTKVSWWPFIAYMVVWLGAAGYTVWQLQQLPAGQAAYEAALYGMSLQVGLGLLAAGPALLLIVWLASWIGRQNVRIGSMFLSALIKGATATFFGALVWLGALLLIDYLRLGHWQ